MSLSNQTSDQNGNDNKDVPATIGDFFARDGPGTKQLESFPGGGLITAIFHFRAGNNDHGRRALQKGLWDAGRAAVLLVISKQKTRQANREQAWRGQRRHEQEMNDSREYKRQARSRRTSLTTNGVDFTASGHQQHQHQHQHQQHQHQHQHKNQQQNQQLCFGIVKVTLVVVITLLVREYVVRSFHLPAYQQYSYTNRNGYPYHQERYYGYPNDGNPRKSSQDPGTGFVPVPPCEATSQ